jgi:hypothetical protein
MQALPDSQQSVRRLSQCDNWYPGADPWTPQPTIKPAIIPNLLVTRVTRVLPMQFGRSLATAVPGGTAQHGRV